MPPSRILHEKDEPQAAPVFVTDRLFPAAIAAFSERDFHAVGMRDICAASGVSTATVYKYFRSKEALLFAILKQELDSIDTSLESAIASVSSYQDKWRACFRELMRHYDERPDLATVYFITVPTKTWISEGSWASFGSVDRLTTLVEEGRRAGTVDDEISSSMLVSLFYMLCAREVQLWYHHGRRWRLSARADGIFRVFWKTIHASC